MPMFTREDDVHLYFEESGDPQGPPVLLIAPGGMSSTLERWSSAPWDPIEQLSEYRVIAMDQRNAGRSSAPVQGSDGWATYRADQLALMDHLGIDRFAVIGMCIGGPYAMGLLRHAPERVRCAVIFQPIGLLDNRETFFALHESWADEIRDEHPEASEQDWTQFRENMFGGEFLFNTEREEVGEVEQPVLLFMGQDIYHPEEISRELAQWLPAVTFVEAWKSPEFLSSTDEAIRAFLREHGG